MMREMAMTTCLFPYLTNDERNGYDNVFVPTWPMIREMAMTTCLFPYLANDERNGYDNLAASAD